ncbi:MAG TPA: alanine dehydrogenase [Vicinamibacteria bacterium]|nr:alanine dehydrogenase [Vicinamibacteria bacterium]
MIIGCVRETKDNEYRVGLVPGGARALADSGHEVLVERGAGLGSGIEDAEYEAAGARLAATAAEVWQRAEILVKVKEPIEPEYPHLRAGQVLFTYLHLAPLPQLTRVLLERKVTGVAYETITGADGSLPLLTPMSEVAGRMAIQVGARYLEKPNGGRGVLLGGVPGVPPAEVIIIGGGVVGMNAAKMAVGLGARVTVLEKSVLRMQYIDDVFGSRVATLMSNPLNIANAVARADLLVGAVLIPGAAAPQLVTRAMIGTMKKGAVVVDVAVDQGGCIETTRPTTHSQPTFEVDGVLHYCVANMPGAVPRTSTFALTNVTLPYLLNMANRGLLGALGADPSLVPGVNTYDGQLACGPVGEAQKLAVKPLKDLLAART